MNVKKIVSAFLFTGTAIVLNCCKDNTVESSDTFPASNLSYTQHIQPIFNTYCATIDCHDPYTMSYNLDLTNFISATHSPGVILPGDADHSLLVESIEGRIQPQMPPNRPPLSANKIKAIRTWINEGAKNN